MAANQAGLAGLLADRLHRPRAEIASLERAVFGRDYDTKSHTEQAAILLLLALSGATALTASVTLVHLQRLVDAEGAPAIGMLAEFLEALRDFNGKPNNLAMTAYRSTVAVEIGDDADSLTVRITIRTDDGDEVVCFTVDGRPNRPDQGTDVGTSLYIGGRLLLQIAGDLWDFDHGIC